MQQQLDRPEQPLEEMKSEIPKLESCPVCKIKIKKNLISIEVSLLFLYRIFCKKTRDIK